MGDFYGKKFIKLGINQPKLQIIFHEKGSISGLYTKDFVCESKSNSFLAIALFPGQFVRS